jgi:uncharacterized protein (DUF305 family)
MRFRQATGAALMAACLVGAATASATSAAQPVAASSGATQLSAAAANSADAEFAMMMIPHHFQALVMSDLVIQGGSDAEVRQLAERIDLEQDIEIDSMQAWQGWNGLEVTDAEEAYQDMLQDPEMLHHMGMATPAELADLDAAQGTAADVLFLQLMIRHHQGAIDMIVDVLINGSDETVQQMANDMGVTQDTQIQQMQEMLDRLS